MYIIEALMLGLLGSFHCVGMCGPIAVALPLNNTSWLTRITGSLLYNSGRTITYSLMGLLFGLVGMGVKMGGFQQWVSIAMGIIMILAVLVPAFFGNIRLFDRTSQRLTGFMKNRFRKLLIIRSNASLFTIGILNGFLPCGLVYMAIAGALATGDIADSTLFMFLFGLGTIPMLFILNIAGNIVTARFRRIIQKIIPVFIVIIGLLFILRGMNLGIKYISPKSERLQPRMEQPHP